MAHRCFVAPSDFGVGLWARDALHAGQALGEYNGPRLPLQLHKRGECAADDRPTHTDPRPMPHPSPSPSTPSYHPSLYRIRCAPCTLHPAPCARYVLQIPGTEIVIDGASENSPFALARCCALHANHSARPNARLELWPVRSLSPPPPSPRVYHHHHYCTPRPLLRSRHAPPYTHTQLAPPLAHRCCAPPHMSCASTWCSLRANLSRRARRSGSTTKMAMAAPPPTEAQPTTRPSRARARHGAGRAAARRRPPPLPSGPSTASHSCSAPRPRAGPVPVQWAGAWCTSCGRGAAARRVGTGELRHYPGAARCAATP